MDPRVAGGGVRAVRGGAVPRWGRSAHRLSAGLGCLVAVLLATLGACSGDDTKASTPTASTSSSTSATTVRPGQPSGPEGGLVPPGFAAASATFVSLQTGWVLGTAPCASPPCTSIARTRDGGRTWVGIPAPPADLAVELTESVRHLRFADADNGWAFGPQLWATHDGGARWRPISLPRAGKTWAVTDLAASAGKAHLAVIAQDGIRILTTSVDSDEWEASPTLVPIGAGPVPNAQLVLQGEAGWLIEVDRVVIGGARLVDGAWVAWQPPCADAGGAAFLAASTADDVIAVCNEGQWNDRPRAVRAYQSSDGGLKFNPIGTPVPLSGASAVTVGRPGSAVVAGTDAGGAAVLVATFDGGATWATVDREATGNWVDIGFTSPDQGFAVPSMADSPAVALLMTDDGGHTWHVVQVK